MKNEIKLLVNDELADELQKAAGELDITVIELMRKFIKLGLVAVAIGRQDDSMLIFRKGESEREITLK